MDATQAGTPAMLEQWTAAQAGFHRLATRLTDEVTRRTGLPASSIQVLLLLLQSPPYHTLTMTQLARHLEFSTAGITKVTDRLGQSGLIERSPCQTDRRVVRATLTPQGLQAAGHAADLLADAVQQQVIARIGEDGLARLAGLVAAVDLGR
jgi:DNA-binding MarR family transcriptional regulator